MRVAKLNIQNFRGIRTAELIFPEGSAVLIGDNNVGKSTILDSLDLVLGPDRMSRRPVIDEHDFICSTYLDPQGEPIKINIEVIIVGLSTAQQATFNANLEWWNIKQRKLVDETTDDETIPALRVCFIGNYDIEEDDFIGNTYFSSPVLNEDKLGQFRTTDKRECGFLYLRALRTGSRALSLEKGSLLDIILRLKEVRPKMWENVLGSLRTLPVADDASLGLGEIFTGLQTAIQKFVPAEWGTAPHLKVSDLTRESLRKTLTAFIATGIDDHAAPFQHQGTGTINMLVLALLSMIADEKQNVIFAMEEPEIAIPPYAQKRIVESITKMSSQAIFTSHSPYVIEEFEPNNVLVLQRHTNGVLNGKTIELPPSIKYKRYRSEFRGKFAEALLSRRVLIAEGATEVSMYSAASKRLAELDADAFASLAGMGIAVCDAGSDTQVAAFGSFYSDLGKTIFAVYDLQTEEQSELINAAVHHGFMCKHKGAEKLIIEESDIKALTRFLKQIMEDNEWPSHLTSRHTDPFKTDENVKVALFDYFKNDKNAGRIADFIVTCTKDEMPSFIVETLSTIKKIVSNPDPRSNTDSEKPETTG